MNDEIILKLINSGIFDDTALAAYYIGEMDDPKAFMRRVGRVLTGPQTPYKHLGDRYAIGKNPKEEYRYYYKISENYFLLLDTSYISECWTQYNTTVGVVNHKEGL